MSPQQEVVNECKCKGRNLDIMFAAAIVGDGNNNVIGTITIPCTSKTTSLCFAAFGEVNEDLNKVT
jgi:hypothetical protein